MKHLLCFKSFFSDKNGFETKGSLREGRKFPACGTFYEKTGGNVGVAVGGLDITNNPIKSAEVYFDMNGEWILITQLPSPYGMGTVSIVGNRLLFIGGMGEADASSHVYVFNKQTGWHLTNLRTSSGKSEHVSTAIRVDQISVM